MTDHPRSGRVHRRPTINDVAQRAGVSKSLVSLALAGSPRVAHHSRTAIMTAAAELGYRPNAAARSLAQRRTGTVGVLVLTLHNPVFAEILDGLQVRLREHGIDCMLVTGDADPERERAVLDTLLDRQVEGLVLIAHRQRFEDLERLAAECPITVITRHEPGIPGLDSIGNDDTLGAGLAVEHCYHLGHRRIWHVTGGDSPVLNARQVGYRQAMHRLGLAAQAHCIPGDITEEAGYAGARIAMSTSAPPTALLMGNDLAAIGALAAAKDLGLSVPQDISIVGYDGISLGGLRSIDITTIAQPLTDLGSRAADLLMARIREPGGPSRAILVEPALTARGSTGPAPHTDPGPTSR